jgi:hypothetical protein
MSAKTSKKTPPQPQISNATDFRSIYVNFAQTAAGPTDISLGVGEALPTNSGVVGVEMKARLVMAPLQAKIVLAMLFQVIRQYETQYGKIAIPDLLAEQLSDRMPEAASASGSAQSTEGD